MASETGHARLAERLAGVVAALVVLALIGFMAWQAVSTTAALPDLVVTVEPPIAEGEVRHLRFTVLNRGGTTASAVTVSATLRDSGSIVDKRSVAIDFVPAGSRVRGGFFLGPADEGLSLNVAVEGYVDP